MVSPEQAVDTINQRYGRHAGRRALHAKGIFLGGTFTATPAAKGLTRAAHMQGEPVEATVRFSNGAGDPDQPDYAADVRGMATTFRLPDGSRTDISAQTVPHFPVRTPDDFIALLRANMPGRARLIRLPLFLLRHREALRALRVNAPTLRPPASFATCRYYGVHAFKWIDSDGGEHWVRYTWIPEASADPLSKDEAKSRGADYLREEIRERVERAGVRFTLELQLAADGDPVDDPNALWPEDRPRVAAGTLELRAVERDPEADGEVMVFDPVRVTDGIEPSNDPVLQFRPRAYSVSVDRRGAG